jgi:hypothetical protein
MCVFGEFVLADLFGGSVMRNRSFVDEAKACRRQAKQFAGRPEAGFLLQVARSFEELEAGPRDRLFSDNRETAGM